MDHINVKFFGVSKMMVKTKIIKEEKKLIGYVG